MASVPEPNKITETLTNETSTNKKKISAIKPRLESLNAANATLLKIDKKESLLLPNFVER